VVAAAQVKESMKQNEAKHGVEVSCCVDAWPVEPWKKPLHGISLAGAARNAGVNPQLW